MKKNRSENFLKAFKWLLLQNQILGIVTFNFTKGKEFHVSTVRCIANIVVVILHLLVTIYVIYESFVYYSGTIYTTTDVIQSTSTAIYVMTIWICSILNRKDFISLLSKLVDFDWKLRASGSELNYGQQRRKILIQQGARIIYYITLIPFLFYAVVILYQIKSSTLGTALLYFSFVVSSAMCHQIIELVLMLKHRFCILNERILGLVKYFEKNEVNIIEHNFVTPTADKKHFQQLQDLCNICSLHHYLSKLIKLVNKTFGVILLFMFAVSFIITVVSVFYCSAYLQASQVKWMAAAASLLNCSTFVIDTVYVCEVCYSTVEEANRSGELIHKIDTVDHDIRDEVEMFSLQIANEQVEFNAAGFFPINYTLLFSIIGGVTTYIIILIQLSSTLSN